MQVLNTVYGTVDAKVPGAWFFEKIPAGTGRPSRYTPCDVSCVMCSPAATPLSHGPAHTA